MSPKQEQNENVDRAFIDPVKLPLPKGIVESDSNISEISSAQQGSKGNETPSAPMTKSVAEKPDPAKKKGTPWLRDIIGLAVFVAVVAFGAWFINSFIFRSFNVVGPSMEPTLYGGHRGASNDRLIIDLMPETIARIRGRDWIPDRGNIIVFRNPSWNVGHGDEYVVKRVIGLPGERITIEDCVLRVHNDRNPDGFDPYPDFKNLASNDREINHCVDGHGTDKVVPEGEIFVVGDHRVNNYSMDSRDGDDRASFGTVPLEKIIGRVAIRIWPLNRFTFF